MSETIWSSSFGAKKLLADVKDANIPWTAFTHSEEQLRAKYQWHRRWEVLVYRMLRPRTTEQTAPGEHQWCQPH